MKGCFSLIIKVVIAILVFFGLVHLGVVDFVKKQIDELQSSKQEHVMEDEKDGQIAGRREYVIHSADGADYGFQEISGVLL